MLTTILTLLAIVVLVEGIYRPRFDKTRDGRILLWYGRRLRKYLTLN